MATKLYDIAVEVARFTGNDGKEKKRWKNIGAVWTSTDIKGEKYNFIMLDRSFNPAGVPCKDGADAIRASLFKQKNNADNNSQQQTKHDFSSDTDGDFEDINECPF